MPALRSKPLLAHGKRRQTIVESLLTEIFQGRLRAGQRLVTEQLARRFGVSHTPIREGLIELAGIGIVDLFPNRGAIVRPVTARDVREICHVRRILECAATRSACGRIDLPELHRLAEGIRALTVEGTPVADAPGSPKTFVQQARVLDSRLHDLIADSCGNTYLANELSRLKTLFRAFRDVAWQHDQARNDYHRIAEEGHEHLAIVEALLDGDGKSAAKAMASHIRSGVRYWSRSMPVDGDMQSHAKAQRRKE
ncbi:MAG: GntR family transcriptional regulator [Planctomycetes bacterium]|nr:GntR family transcriptional regulator [Planctomycetota bacterium]